MLESMVLFHVCVWYQYSFFCFFSKFGTTAVFFCFFLNTALCLGKEEIFLVCRKYQLFHTGLRGIAN